MTTDYKIYAYNNFKLFKTVEYLDLPAPAMPINFMHVQKFGFDDKEFKLKELELDNLVTEFINIFCHDGSTAISIKEYLNYCRLYLNGLEARSVAKLDEKYHNETVFEIWKYLFGAFKFEYISYLSGKRHLARIYRIFQHRMPGVFDNRIIIEVNHLNDDALISSEITYVQAKKFDKSLDEHILLLVKDQANLLKLINYENILGSLDISDVNKKLIEAGFEDNS